MVESICNKLTLRIRTKMPEIDDERAEIINYGLQLLIGEIPKTFILFLIAYIFGALKITLIALLVMLPYRTVSGGVHLNTHIGCVVATSLFYTGNAVLSKYLILTTEFKYIAIVMIWIFAMIMIKLYAPADTVAVPILRKKERKVKKILSYIIMTITLIIALIVKDRIISNILIVGTFLQSFAISRAIYKITNNKYGYEEYINNNLDI